MSAQSATLAGRAAAERLMVDTCTITRVTGGSSDPETGVRTQTTTVVYTGKCRFKMYPRSPGRRTDVAEASVVEVDEELQIPMSATGVQVEDIVTCTASLLDPDLPGRVFTLTKWSGGSQITARRFHTLEVAS